jgi:hypothetical protein
MTSHTTRHPSPHSSPYELQISDRPIRRWCKENKTMERAQTIRLYLMSKLRICKAIQSKVWQSMRASQLRQNMKYSSTNITLHCNPSNSSTNITLHCNPSNFKFISVLTSSTRRKFCSWYSCQITHKSTFHLPKWQCSMSTVNPYFFHTASARLRLVAGSCTGRLPGSPHTSRRGLSREYEYCNFWSMPSSYRSWLTPAPYLYCTNREIWAQILNNTFLLHLFPMLCFY